MVISIECTPSPTSGMFLHDEHWGTEFLICRQAAREEYFPIFSYFILSQLYAIKVLSQERRNQIESAIIYIAVI
jgi:hypothetical protein